MKLVKLQRFVLKCYAHYFESLWIHFKCLKFVKFCPINIIAYTVVCFRDASIGRLLHYTKNSLSSLCTSLHKHEQKDRTKTCLQTISRLTLVKLFKQHKWRYSSALKKRTNIHRWFLAFLLSKKVDSFVDIVVLLKICKYKVLKCI